jgi:hypothetical protein
MDWHHDALLHAIIVNEFLTKHSTNTIEQSPYSRWHPFPTGRRHKGNLRRELHSTPETAYKKYFDRIITAFNILMIGLFVTVSVSFLEEHTLKVIKKIRMNKKQLIFSRYFLDRVVHFLLLFCRMHGCIQMFLSLFQKLNFGNLKSHERITLTSNMHEEIKKSYKEPTKSVI